MANTQTVDALRQELWSKELLDDVMRDVENIMRFMGDGANNVIQVSRELGKRKGDVETFGLVARLTGDGVTGDDELEGNEESMLSYSEQVSIDQIRNAVRLKGKLDNQKVIYDQIAAARENIRVWMKEYLARQCFMKLGGVTNPALVDTNGVVYSARNSWSNTPDFIPDADEAAGSGARYLCANAGGTDALGAGDTMTLDIVVKAATRASLANPRIQKIQSGGDEFWVMYLHPLQVRDIRLSSDWKTAQQNARERSENNPVFSGALGFWAGVLLLENEYAPWLDVSVSGNSFRGVATGTDCAVDAARALLCGRQACLYAEASNPEALVVETFDYKNKDGVAGSFIGGLQKAMFNSKEFGVIAVDTAAAL
ncbi:MAG: N4-gp56 family major capsid protein [Patescibacteria group bacterium]